MKAYSTTTPLFRNFCKECLEDWWCLVNSDIPLEVIVDDRMSEKGGSFRDAVFEKHLVWKYSKISEFIDNNKNPIWITDCDITYFRPIRDLVEEELQNGYDILVAQDLESVGGLNIGQLAIKPSEGVKKFFENFGEEVIEAYNTSEKGPVEQTLLRKKLSLNEDIKWKHLPKGFANMAIHNSLSEDQRKDIYSIHYTGTVARNGKTSLELKYEHFHNTIKYHPAALNNIYKNNE